MARTNPARNRLGKIWPLAEAVGFDLPDDVVAAKAKEDSLKAALTDARADRSNLPNEGDLQDELFEAGKPTEAYRKRLAAVLAERPLLDKQELHLSFAIERAEGAVISAVQSATYEIITESLQPALAEIVDTVAAHAEPARRIPWRDFEAAMFNQDVAVRDAFVAIERQHKRYVALRDAQDLLHGDANNEATQRFGRMRNLREVWPGFAARGPGIGRPPWEDMTGMQTLNWLVNEGGAELWCPTPDELESVWQEAVEAGAPKPARAVWGVSAGS